MQTAAAIGESAEGLALVAFHRQGQQKGKVQLGAKQQARRWERFLEEAHQSKDKVQSSINQAFMTNQSQSSFF